MKLYKEKIERALDEAISTFGPQTRLREAISYSLKHGGKRLRPSIVFLVAEALGSKFDVTHGALAVEYFHTASLIADDLPCMDDDDERRGVPSLHIAFDQATALLASYALISAGYDAIRQGAQKLPNKALCALAVGNAAHNTGIHGATGGQYHDLFAGSPSKELILDIIDRKTGTLFEIAFVLGWLFGGGDPIALSEVKKMAKHFGRAFQLADDFQDQEQDKENLNTVNLLGVENATQLFELECTQFEAKLKKLRLDSPELIELIEFVRKSALLRL